MAQVHPVGTIFSYTDFRGGDEFIRKEDIAIALDEQVEWLDAFVRQQRLTFPVLLDSDTRAAAIYNPRKQLPMLHIFDRSGRIVYTHTTFVPGDARELRAKILVELER